MSTLAPDSRLALRADTTTIGVVSLAHGTSHFFQLLLPPLFPWLATEFSLSFAELGTLASLFYLVSALGQAAAGFVVDRVGARAVMFAGLGLFALAAEIGGAETGRWLQALVEGTDELPLEAWLKRVDVSLIWEAATTAPGLGVRTAADGDAVRLANVFDGGAAQAAGLSAGDVLVALDGLKVNAGNLDKLLARRLPGEEVEIHAFRRDELMHFAVSLHEAPRDTAKLSLVEEGGSPAHLALREAWLGG